MIGDIADDQFLVLVSQILGEVTAGWYSHLNALNGSNDDVKHLVVHQSGISFLSSCD
jgi:hypothetical protein